MTHVTRRLTAKNHDQLRKSTLGNRVWAKNIIEYCWLRDVGAVLWIAEIPRVSVWPTVQQFVSGSRVRVACSAAAHPPATLAWRQGDSGQLVDSTLRSSGVNLQYEDGSRISADHEGLLTIVNASADDAGRWECIATNDQGVASNVAHLQYIGTALFVYYLLTYLLGHVECKLVAWHSGRTSVSGRRTFPVLRLTCS